jgi:hypothetical protein
VKCTENDPGGGLLSSFYKNFRDEGNDAAKIVRSEQRMKWHAEVDGATDMYCDAIFHGAKTDGCIHRAGTDKKSGVSSCGSERYASTHIAVRWQLRCFPKEYSPKIKATPVCLADPHNPNWRRISFQAIISKELHI